jgi:DNA-binding IclR family transcriptional regulator
VLPRRPLRARPFVQPGLLGSLGADRYDISDAARDSVRLLARETGESVFFSARRGTLRFRPERQPEFGHLLLEQSHELSRRLAASNRRTG